MSDDEIENEFDTGDFDDGGFDDDGFDDGGFDDLSSQKGTLGDLWRNNPLVKVGVILTGFLLLVGGVILFGGKKEPELESRVTRQQDLTETPGTAETTQVIRDAIEEVNAERAETALRENTSAIPMPVDPVKGALPLQFEEPEEEDPLERWRRMQEARIKEQQLIVPPEPDAPPEPEVDTRTPAINALAQAMSQQMESVLGNQEIKGPIVQDVATMAYLEDLAAKERARLEELLARQREQQEEDEDELTILIPAGTIEYAQLITEANTDAPGPILAELVTGPLRGGRLIGNFTATENFLILDFNTIVLDGVDYAANGIALDPDTTLPGVITEIDRRYFKRVILPAAAEFVTGFTEAVSESGTTSVTINNADGSVTETNSNTGTDDDQEVASGITAAGDALADILDDIADNTQPMLRVARGTPVGILFTAPVVDQPQLLQQQQQQQQQAAGGIAGQLPALPTGVNLALP